MRTSIVVLGAVLLLLGSIVPAETVPSTWQPAYWNEALRSISTLRERGDKQAAENLCFTTITYAEQQAIHALEDYAALLDSQTAASGAEMRAKAERLAQVKEQQRRATKPGNAYLGFVPWDELTRYADALQDAHRDSNSQAIRELAAAYKHTQEAFVKRTLLMRQGKDPRGEC
jgi:hypothetical protein